MYVCVYVFYVCVSIYKSIYIYILCRYVWILKNSGLSPAHFWEPCLTSFVVFFVLFLFPVPIPFWSAKFFGLAIGRLFGSFDCQCFAQVKGLQEIISKQGYDD
jgi:hypothetical protein